MLVDQLTEWHLKILTLAHNPEFYAHTYNVSSGSLAGLIERVYPELNGQREIYQHVWRDLHQRGLVRDDSDILYGSMTGSSSGVFAKRTTGLGDRFLAFITAPSEAA